MPLVKRGYIHFGENKVQEAEKKWLNIKQNFPKIKLHMVGKLQTNKVKQAVKIFDYIHSLDNERLALKLSSTEKTLEKKLKYFIQINLGNEIQKSGITLESLDPFYNYCIGELRLDIVGLMIIPPNDGNEEKYFKLLSETNKSLGLKELSMGMSNDYKLALKYDATFIRIGSLLFAFLKLCFQVFLNLSEFFHGSMNI